MEKNLKKFEKIDFFEKYQKGTRTIFLANNLFLIITPKKMFLVNFGLN